MAGGLIQIAAYGSQDLFLTGVPEITFFKVVYRRHTQFSMESIQVNFNNNVGFGQTSVAELLKVGDLISKMYLYVILPEINLQRNVLDDPTDFIVANNTAKSNYDTMQIFMGINRNAYTTAYDHYIAENSANKTQQMINGIQTVFNRPGNSVKTDNFKAVLTSDPSVPFNFTEISMDSISDLFNNNSNPDDLFKALSVGIDKSIKTYDYFFRQLKDSTIALKDVRDPNIKFAWVNRVGHFIAHQIEVKIGGHKIDRHYGDWLNIWYELTANREMEQIYFKMIGNVDQLTDFNRIKKPQYLLKIPLQFWFCRFSGLAIPLVSLEYHDVSLHVSFRNLEDLSYIESGNTVKYSRTADGLLLDEVSEELNLDINAYLMVDYIYLDSLERRRFAQSSHEYLIEQLQILDINNYSDPKIQVLLNNFVHPSKEIIWVAQQSKYRSNPDGFTKCQWDNYSISDNNEGNPIVFSHIDFHSYNRVARYDGNYFNYVQPYETHHSTPSDGINMYSFAIIPEEFQPSGTANFSRLSRIILYLEFSRLLFPGNGLNEPLDIKIYTRNINILRFLNGMSGLAFTYG